MTINWQTEASQAEYCITKCTDSAPAIRWTIIWWPVCSCRCWSTGNIRLCFNEEQVGYHRHIGQIPNVCTSHLQSYATSSLDSTFVIDGAISLALCAAYSILWEWQKQLICFDQYSARLCHSTVTRSIDRNMQYAYLTRQSQGGI